MEMDDGKFVDALGDLRIDNFRLLRLASDWFILHHCHLSSECGKVRKSADLFLSENQRHSLMHKRKRGRNRESRRPASDVNTTMEQIMEQR